MLQSQNGKVSTSMVSNHEVRCCAVWTGAEASAQDVCVPVRLGPTLLSRLKAEAKDCCTWEDAGRDW